MKDIKALILAAGAGTRLSPVLQGRPKPLIEIGGETILGRILRWLSRQGVRRTWINLHHHADVIRDLIGEGAKFGIEVSYSYEPEILGTAGAVRRLAPEWSDAFLVIYGDNLLELDLKALIDFHHSHKALGSLALFDTRIHSHTGIAGGRVHLDSGNRIVRFAEGEAADGSTLVNAGVYIFSPAIVDEISPNAFCDFGKDLFPDLLSRGRPIYGHIMTSGYCLGLDTPASYFEAIRMIEAGEVKLS